MVEPSKERTKVFVCYSRKDTQPLKRLRKHLKPLMRDQPIDYWDDTRVLAGSQWRQEIKDSIQTTRVAILLISANFLNSDFINQNELPPLLAAAKHDNVTILPVLISQCFYEATSLAEFQFVHDPSKALNQLPEGDRELVWVQVVKGVKRALQPSSDATLASATTHIHVGKQETQHPPALQEALRMLSNQKFDQEKRSSWIFTVASMIPTLNEEEKKYLRGQLHRIRFYENSDLLQEYVTLVLGLLDDKAVFNDMRAIFQRSHDTLPLPLRKQLLEYIAQQRLAYR